MRESRYQVLRCNITTKLAENVYVFGSGSDGKMATQQMWK